MLPIWFCSTGFSSQSTACRWSRHGGLTYSKYGVWVHMTVELVRLPVAAAVSSGVTCFLMAVIVMGGI